MRQLKGECGTTVHAKSQATQRSPPPKRQWGSVCPNMSALFCHAVHARPPCSVCFLCCLLLCGVPLPPVSGPWSSRIATAALRKFYLVAGREYLPPRLQECLGWCFGRQGEAEGGADADEAESTHAVVGDMGSVPSIRTMGSQAGGSGAKEERAGAEGGGDSTASTSTAVGSNTAGAFVSFADG